MKVLLIVERVTLSGHYGSYDESHVLTEEGFFTTRERAEARIEEMYEEYRLAYDQHVKTVTRINERKFGAYARKLAEWEILTANGLDNPRPTEPTPTTQREFRDWLRHEHNNLRFVIEEVREAEGFACKDRPVSDFSFGLSLSKNGAFLEAAASLAPLLECFRAPDFYPGQIATAKITQIGQQRDFDLSCYLLTSAHTTIIHVTLHAAPGETRDDALRRFALMIDDAAGRTGLDPARITLHQFVTTRQED